MVIALLLLVYKDFSKRYDTAYNAMPLGTYYAKKLA